MSVNYSWIGPTKEWLGPLYLGVARNQEISAFTNHIPLFFIKPVSLKGNQPWILIGRTDAKAETPVFWSSDANNWLFGKVPDAGKDWGQEKRVSEYEMAGWHHQCNRHELGQTLGNGEGQGGLACCSPWGYRVGHDWATEQQEQLKTFLLLVLFVLLVSLGELLSQSLCSQFSKILWCSFF